MCSTVGIVYVKRGIAWRNEGLRWLVEDKRGVIIVCQYFTV